VRVAVRRFFRDFYVFRAATHLASTQGNRAQRRAHKLNITKKSLALQRQFHEIHLHSSSDHARLAFLGRLCLRQHLILSILCRRRRVLLVLACIRRSYLVSPPSYLGHLSLATQPSVS